MSSCIPISLAVEDALSEYLLRELFRQHAKVFSIEAVYGKTGFGYLKKNIRAFNNAARFKPWFVLTDLDQLPCAPELINEWLPDKKHKNLIFRVAVREIESWILADIEAFANFWGISERQMPQNPDVLADPKEKLLNLVRKSRKRKLKDSVVRRQKEGLTTGPDYNGVLGSFIRNQWRYKRAEKLSPSLKKAVSALSCFERN